VIDVKCHRNEYLGNQIMKRGKPHERETQIMVGELGYGNKNGF